MADKNFKGKNKLVINGLSGAAGPLISDSSNVIDSTPSIATQYGGTGTTTSPSAGQVLYSSSGTTYAPTTLSSLVQGAKYQADAPSSPATGDIWIESDSNSDSFDPNIIRRKSFTATAGQTAFVTDVNFVDGYEQVYFNGLLLLRTTDYTTSGNNTITLVSAAALNDIVEVVTVTNLNSVNTYTQAEINSAILTAVPSQTGHTGKYLTTNGSATSWGTVSQYSLPSQSGNNGKFLTTNGTSESWATVVTDPNPNIFMLMGA